MDIREVRDLVRLEWQLDLRRKHAWGSMALYVASTVYVCYQGVRNIPERPTWNALFWIILLFAAFNALTRSFQREDGGRQLYLHTLAGPRSVVMARTFYNALVMAVLGLVTLAAYALFIGSSPLENGLPPLFVATVLVGATGFAFVLTLIAALAARAGNGVGLMAVLGLPLVLPMLLVSIRAGKLALDGIGWNVVGGYIGWLFAIDALVLALAWLLFPYLWRD